MEQQTTTKIENKTHLVKFSFYNTYAFLLTTATITFIEAMRNPNSQIRHILNLETCISVVAAFFYSQFVEKIKDSEIDYQSINITRYTDWAITTPIMLLVLVLAIQFNSTKKTTVVFNQFMIILLLNYLMLGCGYLGELGTISQNMALATGFVFFFLLYGYIYYRFIASNPIFDNLMIYGAFFFFWALYGVVYPAEDETRNISYNVLDLFAKCFVGIFFWAYFTKIFTLK